MIIKKLTKDDVREHDKLTSQAFSYSCNINDKASVLPCENMLGAFADDNKTLFADMEINDRVCFYGKNTLTCAAVGGVAAKPEHRGKGAVKGIFNVLFKDEKYDISILYPFSDGYYRNLGYESVGFSLSLKMMFTELSDIKRYSDLTLFEGNKTEEILCIYNECAKKHPLCFKRENISYFPENPYLSQEFTYYNKKGLITFFVSREKSTLFVKEIYYSDTEALFELLGFLRNYEANCKYLVFNKLPQNSPVLNIIKNYKECELKLNNTGSARILNVENVLKKHDYKNLCGEFTLKINDTVERNNGTFRVKFKDGNVKIKNSNRLKPDFIFDIASASKIILSGIEAPESMKAMRGVQILNDNPDFYKAFSKEHPHFTDEF